MRHCPSVLSSAATFQEISSNQEIQIKRKNFRKNEMVSLNKKIIDQIGGIGFGKKGNHQNSLIKNKNDNLFHTLVFNQVF